jgi:hypothetical protein
MKLVALALAAAVAPVSGHGAGSVKLGMTYRQLRAQHLVGAIRPGCELGGPNTRSAPLRAPLRGIVDLTPTRVRRVADIAIAGGAAAHGVGIGATIARIRATFPHARVDHATDHTFGFTSVRVPRSEGGPFEFAVSIRTHRANTIGIPRVPVCD